MDHFTKISLEETDFADVVIGLCPGCELWQVDYTTEVRESYIWWKHDRSWPPFKTPILDEWHEVIETVLAEHVMECVHLQRVLVD